MAQNRRKKGKQVSFLPEGALITIVEPKKSQRELTAIKKWMSNVTVLKLVLLWLGNI